MKSAFDIKSARLDALAIRLNSMEVAEWESTLAERAAQYQELNMPMVLDIPANATPDDFDIAAITTLFQAYQLPLIALRHEDAKLWENIARHHHLAFNESVKIIEPSEDATNEPVPTTLINQPTVFVSTPVRTGQQVYAENADLIVTGIVSSGAELIADGNIHVYSTMRGRAIAGASGRRDARIFIHHMQAELVSVGGIFRNFEQDLPEHLHKKAVQIHLEDNRLIINPINH